MRTYIITITLLIAINAQTFDVQDLSNNNGYLPIKTGEIRTVENYIKTLHIINMTYYEQTIDIIKGNIDKLTASNTDSKTLLDTIYKNFMLLKTKIERNEGS